jgi:cytoskeletal protein CcmA (bactofilin family)
MEPKLVPNFLLHSSDPEASKPAIDSLPTRVPAANDAEKIYEVKRDFDDLPNSPPLSIPVIGSAPVLVMAASAELVVEPVGSALYKESIFKSNSMKQTQLPQGWTLRGDLISESNVTISCKVVGNIQCSNPEASINLTESCVSEGDITGRDITLRGHHTGSIDASIGSLAIEASAHITGDVLYTNIKMNGGLHSLTLSYVDGKSDFGRRD